MGQTFLGGLLDLIYPVNCLLCRIHLLSSKPSHLGTILCPRCRQHIELNTPPFCLKCSRHLEGKFHPLCSSCRVFKPHFDQGWSICLYNETMRHLIHLFKYGSRTALRHDFSQIILSFIKNYTLNLEAFDLIVPVPLSTTRLRERGYNQAELLASAIAGQLKIPLIANNLIRTRHTLNQARTHRKDRWTNLKGAFRIKKSFYFSGKSILIVDDLLTTGATASEAAYVLKQAGAGKVGVLTLAIAQ